MGEDAISAAEDTVEDVIEDIESIFSPRPNGMIQRHRDERARRAEAERERENIDSRVEQKSYKTVKVAQTSPETLNAISYTILAGAYAQILPLSPYRYRATVMVITAEAGVILAKDSGNALSGVGFTLPSNVPLPLFGRGQLYAYNDTGVTVIVSVISELYAPEK